MKAARFSMTALLLVALFAASAGCSKDGDPDPWVQPVLVSGVAPSSGPTTGGTSIHVFGFKFVTGATVTIGGNAVTNLNFMSGNEITCDTPAGGAGAADVVVVNSDGEGYTLVGGFTFIAPPDLVSILPLSGPTGGGTSVTLAGTDFQSGVTVRFGGVAATNVVFVGSTSITCDTPAGTAGATDVSVANPCGQYDTLPTAFTFIAPPQITNVNPNWGPSAGGTTIQVNGLDFQNGALVTIGGNICTNFDYSGVPTQITCDTPAGGAGTVDLVVTNPAPGTGNGATIAGGFTYVPPPQISGINPASGTAAGGTNVTISGQDFQNGAGATIGGSACTNYDYTNVPASFTCDTPPGSAGTADVVVTNPDSQIDTLQNGFTFVQYWTVTSNGGAGGDAPYGIAIDSTFAYIAGHDTNPGNAQWRIEKRSLADGSLVGGFGSGGVATNNPSANSDTVAAVAIDSTSIYIVGMDMAPGNNEWRIEKRNMSDGALVGAFAAGGVIQSNPSAGVDNAESIAIDSTAMYVVGFDRAQGNGQWRIEKRLLSDGSLVASFGAGGVVLSNPGANEDVATSIVIDASSMYVVGSFAGTPPETRWRIEKRALADGALVASFGTGGVVTSNPGPGHDYAEVIVIDSTSMYVGGMDQTPGNWAWRIEKRALSDGSLISSFGSGGVISVNPSAGHDGVYAAAMDSAAFYIGGFDSTPGNSRWRLEKRTLTDGSLVGSFGSSGVVTIDLGTGDDIVLGAALDSAALYVAGTDSSAGGGAWRIEKRQK